MKILYDYAAFVIHASGGVSRVLYELFCHVRVLDGVECRLFAGIHKNRYLRDAPPSVKKDIVGWYLPEWLVKQRIFMPINHWLFKQYARRYGPDVCHYTYFDTPKVPKGCKVVITMHDMIHERFPEMYEANDPTSGWKKNAVKRANGIICVSNNTRKDLLTYIPEAGEKTLQVIYHGNSLAGISFVNASPGFRYVLYVGTRDVAYKNFDLVLKALACSGFQ